MVKTGHGEQAQYPSLPINLQIVADAIVGNAILVLKYLVQTLLSTPMAADIASTSQSPLSIISRLARKIDDIRHPQARACVLWLVGQYCASEEKGKGPEGVAEWAPDVLRKGAKTFSQEVWHFIGLSLSHSEFGVDYSGQVADHNLGREIAGPLSD
jgi:hypothetical protein